MTSLPDPSIGLVSTFPPTVCGIATFTHSLVEALGARRKAAPRRVGVVSLTDGPARHAASPVVFHHHRGDRASLQTATAILNTYDTVSVQHEFGIFGGKDGAEVLDLLSGLAVPTAVTLHTVLASPSEHQRAVMDGISDLADHLVVMSETAASRLVDRYDVDQDRITVIAHGADPEFAGPSLVRGDRPLVLTWGLIGPGKGLESAIEAFSDLLDIDPLPRYLIAGATHPRVRQGSGEAYRDGLKALTNQLGLGQVVEFDDRYLSRRELARLVRSADVVVLPYESVEQVTSGVLVEAIAASKPVIATAFPHAVELLSDGAGAVVPFGEPKSLGLALRSVIDDAPSRMHMAERARHLATGRFWPTVAGEFAATMSALTPDRQRATG